MSYCMGMKSVGVSLMFLVSTAGIAQEMALSDSFEATPEKLRVATFNIAFDKVYVAGKKPISGEGEVLKALKTGSYEPAKQVASIVKAVNPDVILLNEIDGNDAGQTVSAFLENYLADSAYQFVSPTCNTGVDSGQDYDNNGKVGDAGDAYGFGFYPGQYCMALLSKYPIDKTVTFQKFLWKDLPNAHKPVNMDGSDWYTEAAWASFRLSSKTHADVTVTINEEPVHFLISHPTPPVFDGEEDRNGKRNFDEIRLFADYISGSSSYLYDDAGNKNVSFPADEKFVILGDLNASAVEGDAFTDASGVKAISQVVLSPQMAAGFDEAGAHLPTSEGGKENAALDRDGNVITDPEKISQYGDSHTAVWKMRADYVLPSKQWTVQYSGVYWPKKGEAGSEWVSTSDHRLVWVDLLLEPKTK